MIVNDFHYRRWTMIVHALKHLWELIITKQHTWLENERCHISLKFSGTVFELNILSYNV